MYIYCYCEHRTSLQKGASSMRVKASLQNPVARETTIETTSEVVSFEVSDRKGRDMGALVVLSVVEIVPTGEADPENWKMAQLPEGTLYAGRVHVTRAGETYGSWQSARYFTTAEARDAFVEQRLADARKRAEKRAEKEALR